MAGFCPLLQVLDRAAKGSSDDSEVSRGELGASQKHEAGQQQQDQPGGGAVPVKVEL